MKVVSNVLHLNERSVDLLVSRSQVRWLCGGSYLSGLLAAARLNLVEEVTNVDTALEGSGRERNSKENTRKIKRTRGNHQGRALPSQRPSIP